MLKKLLSGAVLATSLFALSTPASAYLTNWRFNSAGTGFATAQTVQERLSLAGEAFVQLAYTGATTFTFNEGAYFNVPDILPFTAILPPAITATFAGTGYGDIATSKLAFNAGGLLNVFSGATSIAKFGLLTGGGNLTTGTVLPNGTVELIFKTFGTNMLAGYFFDSLGTDLSLMANSPTGVVLGFAAVQANTQTAGTTAAPQTAGVYTAAFGLNPTGYTSLAPDVFGRPTKLVISNPGNFALQVPEPSMLSLLGIALVGMGFTTRRRIRKS